MRVRYKWNHSIQFYETECLRTEVAQIMERDRQKSVGCAG